jgi:hypothetical protein
VGEYMEEMQEEDPEKYTAHFAAYLQAGVEADELEDLYTKVGAPPPPASVPLLLGCVPPSPFLCWAVSPPPPLLLGCFPPPPLRLGCVLSLWMCAFPVKRVGCVRWRCLCMCVTAKGGRAGNLHSMQGTRVQARPANTWCPDSPSPVVPCRPIRCTTPSALTRPPSPRRAASPRRPSGGRR